MSGIFRWADLPRGIDGIRHSAFGIRHSAFGLILAAAARVVLAQPDLDTLREQEIAQMGEITPNVSVTYGELGTPTFIRSTTAFLSRRSTAAPLDIAAAFVNDNPALFGVPFP
ncbi:MAG: hypothetical protein IT433_07100, partial [Phycisphaerales bacterium]|nr:hypothetical protein [Phycisphaerales bacterium]